MIIQGPSRYKQTSLERPGEPHGRVLRAKASRGHVSDWLLPSRRDRWATRAFARQRFVLIGVFLGAAALALLGPATLRGLAAAAAFAAFLGAFAGGGAAWVRVYAPGLLLLTYASVLALGNGAPHDTQAGRIALVLGMIAIWVGFAALRIDAVHAAPPPPARSADGRERIAPLHVFRVGTFLTTGVLIAATCLLYLSLFPS